MTLLRAHALQSDACSCVRSLRDIYTADLQGHDIVWSESIHAFPLIAQCVIITVCMLARVRPRASDCSPYEFSRCLLSAGVCSLLPMAGVYAGRLQPFIDVKLATFCLNLFYITFSICWSPYFSLGIVADNLEST